jgi:hypothetical protein
MPTIEIPDWLDVRERTAESCVLRDCWGELDELRSLVEPFFEREDWEENRMPLPDIVVTRIHGSWHEVTTVVVSLRGPQREICEVAIRNDESAYRLFEQCTVVPGGRPITVRLGNTRFGMGLAGRNP